LVPVEPAHISSVILPALDAAEPVQVEDKAIDWEAVPAQARLEHVYRVEVSCSQTRTPRARRPCAARPGRDPSAPCRRRGAREDCVRRRGTNATDHRTFAPATNLW